ncbi:MAG: methanogen output domain 1-containing protein [Candidatus Helarchaeota archaeon]
MDEKLKDFCSNIYVRTAMTTLEVLREDMGLARAIDIASKIWTRLGTKLAPLLQEKYELTEMNIPKIVEMLNTFLKDVLCFESSITESSDDKAVITIKPCLEWTKFKEARLPPLCYRMCYPMIENIVKQLNMDINFQPGAQMRQGADRCELVFTK